MRSISNAMLMAISCQYALQIAVGGGISINLVSEFEDLLRKKGAKNYKLSVKGNNHRAIRFYEKCSLELFDDRGDELIMYKNLV